MFILISLVNMIGPRVAKYLNRTIYNQMTLNLLFTFVAPFSPKIQSTTTSRLCFGAIFARYVCDKVCSLL